MNLRCINTFDLRNKQLKWSPEIDGMERSTLNSQNEIMEKRTGRSVAQKLTAFRYGYRKEQKTAAAMDRGGSVSVSASGWFHVGPRIYSARIPGVGAVMGRRRRPWLDP